MDVAINNSTVRCVLSGPWRYFFKEPMCRKERENKRKRNKDKGKVKGRTRPQGVKLNHKVRKKYERAWTFVTQRASRNQARIRPK